MLNNSDGKKWNRISTTASASTIADDGGDDDEDEEDAFHDYNNNRIRKLMSTTTVVSTTTTSRRRYNLLIRKFLRKKTIRYLIRYLLLFIFIVLALEAIIYFKYFQRQSSVGGGVTNSSSLSVYSSKSNDSNQTDVGEHTWSQMTTTTATVIKLVDYKEDLTVHQQTLKIQNSNENYLNMFKSIRQAHVEAYIAHNMSIELCPAIPPTLESRMNFTHLFNNTNLADLISFYEKNVSPSSSNETAKNNTGATITTFDETDNDNLIRLNENMIYGRTVGLGGYWKPSSCISRSKLAVIIPYRDRFVHLAVLLRNLHLILQRQMIDYRIFVTEQYGNKSLPFNKGRIMNAAYLEALKIDPTFNCFVFHDVDLILEDDRNMYTCPPYPRHMSVAIDKFDYHLPYTYLIGGVFLLRTEHFRIMNGYSNSYWGWGGEDDDMYERLASSHLKLVRPLPVFGRYRMIKHSDQKSNPDRFKNLKGANKRYKNDGVNQINYILVNTTLYEGFTHFLFDIGEL